MTPPFPWTDVLIILALVALNGVFAMSELALVSARRPRLEAMARRGDGGARAALALARDPGKLLSTTQIGITLISVIAGAYSGASLGAPVGVRLERLGVPPATAHDLGFGLVIAATTFLSLIGGELVPKQIALRSPERLAALAARPMAALAKGAAPLVWLLGATSAGVFRVLGLRPEPEDRVTAEELHLVVAEASKSGVIEESERAIISGVVRLADRPVREVMTPRTEIRWIDADADEDSLRRVLAELPHSRMLVARGTVDEVVGVVSARDLLARLVADGRLDLPTLIAPAPIVPDQVDAMDALEALRAAPVPFALVHDEYGHLEGIVTPADLLSAIAGEFRSDRHEDDEPAIAEREDGSLLVSGWCAADTLAERIALELPEERDYATVAGLVLAELKRLPQVGDYVTIRRWRIEVVDMDGRRVDKLLVLPAP